LDSIEVYQHLKSISIHEDDGVSVQTSLILHI